MPYKIKFRNSILFRVGASIFIPAVIIYSFMFYLLYTNTEELIEERYINKLHEINLNYADYITNKLSELASKTKLIAQQIEAGEISSEEFLDITYQITNSDNLIYGSAIALVSKALNDNELGFYYSFKGKTKIKQIKFESNEDIGYFDYRNSDIEWWRKPSFEHHSGWTRPYFDHDAGQTDMVTYYQPFFNDGIFLGIITVDVSINLLKDVLLSNEEHFEEDIPTDIFLFSSDSTLVYADNTVLIGRNVLKNEINKKSDKNSSEYKIIANAISGKTGREKFYSAMYNEERFAFYTPIATTNWHAIAVIPYSFIQDSIFEKMWKTIFILIIASIIVMLLVYLITKSITKPIKELSEASIIIAEGKYDYNFQINTKSELGLLADNFNKMSTNLKHREEDLISANKELKVLDDAKTKFLLLISHEIRTPLNGIIGFTDIINDSLEDPEIIEFGELLKQSVNRLDEFSRKALDITQLQTRFNTLKKKEIDAGSTIMSIIETKEQDANLKGIKVNPIIEEEVLHYGIPEYFTGMIEELIDNAIEYSKINSEVKIQLKKTENGYASFCIKNIGDIIPEDKLSLVLQPFGLAQNHIDQNIGLGLYYVKTYLEIHDAIFDIQSNEAGTIFRFDLVN